MTQVLAKQSHDPNLWTLDQFEQFLSERSEPGWLTQQRLAAWRSFQEMNWPGRHDEDWMRSDLRLFHLGKYPLAVDGDVASAKAAYAGAPCHLREGVDLGGHVSIVDGWEAKSHLDKNWADKGVLVDSLDRACSLYPEQTQAYLHTVVQPTSDRFAALHAATWRGGHFVSIPRHVVIDQPIYLDSGISDGKTDLGHTLIVLEEGAEAMILQETFSLGGGQSGFHCGGLEIVLKPGAHLQYVNLQDWGKSVWHFAHHRATVAQDASLRWTVAGMGSRFAQVSQQVALTGEGANCQVNGVMFTQERQQMTYNTLQQHQAPHCRSDFLYKAALQDQSRTVWRGMIQVDPGAFKTDGYQRNDNLILSRDARADSIPGLEILADDVRCTHGSTSGRVDEELIFYAQSRGFTRHEATRMIVSGFFQQIFDRIPMESVRNALGLAISRQVRQYV